MTCSASGTAHAGQYGNAGSVTGTDTLGNQIIADDPSHYFGTSGGIRIIKSVNGNDANTPPGSYIPVGGQITWTYEVTNTGNTTLTGVTVTDDQGVTVSCPAATLGPGQTMICTASGTAQAGQHTNTGTATGTDPSGNTVTASDPSNYFGYTSGISLKKFTNGQDADQPPGPEIPLGDPVTWTYQVTNTGNTNLINVTITDSQGVTVTCPQNTLDPGESMTCTATGTARAGQYENTGTVTAIDPVGNNLTASDPSHYFGVSPAQPCLKLTKTINGPYRTSDNLFLNDRIIPVAVRDTLVPEGKLFYFLVGITVENCNNTTLTGVVVTDTFSNEAYPFETSDPANVTIVPPPSPGGFERETLTWTAGSIPAFQSKTLLIKVGTEFNPSGRLEPTSAPQSIFYNGRNNDTGGASVVTNEGLSAAVGAALLTNGAEISCAGSDGQWDPLPYDRCTTITTPLPITLTATDTTTTSTANFVPRTVSSWRTDAYRNPEHMQSFLPTWLGNPKGQESIKVAAIDQVHDILSLKQGSRLNEIVNLYAQLLACKLNLASGSDPDVRISESANIRDVVSEIDSFLANYSSQHWYLKLGRSQKDQVKQWVKELAGYNSGKNTP